MNSIPSIKELGRQLHINKKPNKIKDISKEENE